MKAFFTFLQFLIGAALWAAFVIILIFFVMTKVAHAEDATAISNTTLMMDRQTNSSIENGERNYRIGLMLNYLHQQAPLLVPGLPDMLRGPVHFVIGQMHSDDGQSDDGGGISSFISSNLSLITPDAANPEALRLSPDYHHMHGIMPFDDSIMMGFDYRNAFSSNNRLKLDVHPYYAQSWHSMEGYWGIETALALGEDEKHPIGKLVIRYDNGNTDVMDQYQRGIDMHADYSFNDNLTMTAGVQNENIDPGNYVLLRWKMSFGN